MTNRFTSVVRQIGGRVLVNGLIMLAALLALGFLINAIDFEDTLASLRFTDEADNIWWNGKPGFVVVAAMIAAVGGPRQVISFFSAYFFGLLWGFVLALCATLLGCMVCYGIARTFRNWVSPYLKGRVDIAIQFWSQNALETTIVIRFLPVGSNLVTNLAAGVFAISPLAFFGGTAIGYVPQTLVFAVMGAGVNVASATQIAISVVLFIVSAALGMLLYARYRKQVKTGSAAGFQP